MTRLRLGLVGALTIAVCYGCDTTTAPPPTPATFQNEVVFASNRDGGAWHLYRMKPDGTNVRLIEGTAGALYTAISPDGKWLAYSDGRDIFKLSADGSDFQRLTPYTPPYDRAPAWSPDGKFIAFQSDRSGLRYQWDVFIMDADGSNVTRATFDAAIDGNPSWSPDGSAIAFYSTRDGNGEIYVSHLDGQPPTNLTNDPSSDDSPEWSPDGTAIAFRSYRDNSLIVATFLMDPDGTNVRVVPTPFLAGRVAWKPDGTRLIVEEAAGDYDLWSVNPDGSDLLNITRNPAADWAPAWSR
jgi:Tol biopolymer transport system component